MLNLPAHCPLCAKELSYDKDHDVIIAKCNIGFFKNKLNPETYHEYCRHHFWIIYNLNLSIKEYFIQIEDRTLKWYKDTLMVWCPKKRQIIASVNCSAPDPWNYSKLVDLYNNLITFS